MRIVTRPAGGFAYHEPQATEPSKWDLWLQTQKERHPRGALSIQKRLLRKRLKTTVTL